MSLKRRSPINFPALSSIILLAIAAVYAFIEYLSNKPSSEKTMQGIFGLLCSALITYIISESLREKSYQNKIIEVINGLAKIERSFAPFKIVSAEERYHIGTDIAMNAKDRIVLFAGSLILLTGPKPYCSPHPLKHEAAQDDYFMKIAQQASNRKNIEFSCSFIPRKLYEELKSLKSVPESRILSTLVYERVNQLEAYCINPKSKFRLREAREGNEVSYLVFIVGDSRFALWLKNAVDPGQDLCISGEDQATADNLVNIFDSLTDPVNYELLKRNIAGVRR